MYKALVEKTKSTPGAKVENNKFCLSVHFRRVDEKVQTNTRLCNAFFLESLTIQILISESLVLGAMKNPQICRFLSFYHNLWILLNMVFMVYILMHFSGGVHWQSRLDQF